LTRLKDDPATGWLLPLDRLIVTVKGWAMWAVYGAILYCVRLAVHYVLQTLVGGPEMEARFGGLGLGRISGLAGVAVGAALIIPWRRLVLRVRSSTIAKMARQAGEDTAAPIDDFAALDAEPDGRLVSLVGWVRGHGYVDHLVDGRRAVGLTLHCQDGVPMVMETMHNFDLVDESGNEALVLTGDGRVYGDTNVQLSRASQDDRNLLMSLDLPATTVPSTWNAFVLRDGDPVMVLGTKSTVQDLTQLQHDRSPQRTAVTSTKVRPLLLFPIAAERREV
jgi:hypothetical protein